MIILTICWIVIIAVASWAAVGGGDSKNINNPKFKDKNTLEGNNKNNDEWDDNKSNTEGMI